MKINPHKLVPRIKKKASSSPCNYRVVAIALNSKGTIVGIKTNIPRNGLASEFRNSFHAEERLIHTIHPSVINKILVARIGKGGIFRPIEPCQKCEKLAAKYNISIREFYKEFSYV